MHRHAITRRSLVLGALGVALTGCAGRDTSETRPSLASPVPSTPPKLPASTPATASIDPAEIAARFADRTPTVWGLDMPGIVTRSEGEPDAVALTFDACGGPHGSGVDTDLLRVLEREGVAATLFLNSRWIETNESLAREFAANPQFLLANHGTAHLPLSVTGEAAYGIAGTASARDAVDEVWGNHQLLTELVGTPPTWFRSGTAHYDDVAVEIVEALGERVAGFAVNGDGGATFTAAQVASETATAVGGDIVIAHMNQPGSGTAAGTADAIAALKQRGLRFVTLPA